MLAAGLPAVRALESLATTGGRWAEPLEQVVAKLSSGHSLAHSFRCGGFDDPVILGVLGLAEKVGTLSGSVQELAALYRWRARMRSELSSKLTYPLVLALACVAFVGVGLPLLLRPILQFLTQSGGAISGATWLLWGFVELLSSPTAVFVALVLLWALVGWGKRRLQSPHHLERALQAVPAVRRCWSTLVSLRYGRALLSALSSGYPLRGALELSASCSGSPALTVQTESAVQRLSDGAALAEVAAALQALDPLLRTTLVLAFESGTIDTLVPATLELLQSKLEADLQRSLILLEPLLLGLMGMVVALCVLGTVTPMMSMLGALS